MTLDNTENCDLIEAEDSSGDSQETSEASEETPTHLNDAVILGENCPELQALLNRPATLLTGEVWGLKDRRNTQDGDWNQVEMPWAQWIQGGDKPAWGFSRHPKGKHKEGACVVLGSSVDGARMARAMDKMYAMGLDIDSGADLDDVLDLLEEKGIFSLVYTSFNHGKRGLEIKRDDVLKKLQISGDPSLPQIQQYLLEHSKSRYETDFVANVTIREQKKQTRKGVVIVLDTPPLHKFRILFPLAEPVKLINLAPSQEECLKIWEDKITGLAQNELGLHFDVSCTDASRLFYTARHPKDAEDWDCFIIQGKPLNFDGIKPMKKAAYTSKREVNPFTEAAGESDHDRPPSCYTPAGNSLNAWHYKAKERFLIADLLDDVCSDRVRVSGGESQGHVHTECPFESEHSEEGGTACMAVNAIDSQNEYWTWFCHHDSCQGRHKLEFLEKALQDGWFEESLLIDDAYLLPADDEDDSEFTADAAGPLELKTKSDVDAEVEKLAAAFRDDKDPEEEIRTFVRRAYAGGMQASVQNWLIDGLAGDGRKQKGCTAWDRNTVKKFLGELDDEARADAQRAVAEEREKAAKDPTPYVPLEKATEETVRRAAENAAWLPSWVHYRDGWFYETNFEEAAKSRRICRAFEVPYIAFGDTDSGRTNEITIRYRDRSAQRGVVESTYRIGDTYRESGSFISRLVDEGFETAPQAPTEKVVLLLRSVKTENEAVLVEKAGWNGDTYVAPSGVVANAADVRYILNPRMRVSADARGTLQEHRQHATTALLGVNGARFLPGYLSGAVGCLADFIGNDMSPILMNEGTANRGKSTALRAGCAWWAPPNHTGLFLKADATATAIENYAVRSNGAVLALDEDGASKLDAGEKQRLVMQWAEGAGRGRGTRDAGVQIVKTWRTCFTTSSERGFLNRLAADDTDIRSGAVSRIFTVDYDKVTVLDPADAGHKDILHAYDMLSKDTGVYGVAGPAFAEKLAELGREDVNSRVTAAMNDWKDHVKGAGRRVVRLAALFRVAGEIAQEAGIFSKKVPVPKYMETLLVDTLDARMEHLDTEAQSMNTLRRRIIRGLQTGEIISLHEDREFNRSEVLGYYGHLAENGRADDKTARKSETAVRKQVSDPVARAEEREKEQRNRTYILPLDRLGKLGVTTDHAALADQLGEALIRRKKGKQKQWFHERVPGEGEGKNIRVSGEFVHGSRDNDGECGQSNNR